MKKKQFRPICKPLELRDNCPKAQRVGEANVRVAKARWPALTRAALQRLRFVTSELGLSIAAGDIVQFDNCWYVTHTGLLRLARIKRCAGIDVRPLIRFCDVAASRWAFKATVYKSPSCRGFVGYGDADPSNVSPQVRGAEMRVAETRAVNRALRKAYGIGICSVEELGAFSGPLPPAGQGRKSVGKPERVNSNGHRPLRDRLCLLIRQHRLDPALVKAYAADYCDVSELRQASREQVATFIKHLAEYAQSDREGLLCQPDRGERALGADLLQTLPQPGAGDRAGAGNGGPDARVRPLPRLLPGDDLCRFLGGSQSGQRQPRPTVNFPSTVFRVPAGIRAAAIPARVAAISMSDRRRNQRRLDRAAYEELKIEILRRDGWTCQHCGRRDQLQVHHLIRRSQSGADCEENLIVLCGECHGRVHCGSSRL